MAFSEYLKQTIKLKEEIICFFDVNSEYSNMQLHIEKWLDIYLLFLRNFLTAYTLDDGSEDKFIIIEQDIYFFENILTQDGPEDAYSSSFLFKTKILKKIVEYFRYPDKDTFKYLYQRKLSIEKMFKMSNILILPISADKNNKLFIDKFLYLATNQSSNNFRSIPSPIAANKLKEE